MAEMGTMRGMLYGGALSMGAYGANYGFEKLRHQAVGGLGGAGFCLFRRRDYGGADLRPNFVY